MCFQELNKRKTVEKMASELVHIGEMEGPALNIFKAKLEAAMAEARSQQAASMTEFHWLGHRFPVSSAKTRVLAILTQMDEHWSYKVYPTFYGEIRGIMLK